MRREIRKEGSVNQVATINQEQRVPVRSVLIDMATRFGMEPAAFEQTVRATCIKTASREEFAAFLLVAKEYNLNPLTKEIYAFPAKGGGIVPIVSIDGWVNLVNSHGACDGFEFEMEHDDHGKLVSCTCRMYRKDRSRPVVITEYLEECKRGTEPWKMQHRMLRHKAMIQAARYAFGFSGIYDEDEGAKIAELRDSPSIANDGPPAPPAAQITHQPQDVTVISEPSQSAEALVEAGHSDPGMVEWADAPDDPPAPPENEKRSGAVASAAASDEGTRAKAAPPQNGDSDMGGAAQPTSTVENGLTGEAAEKLRNALIRDIGTLTTSGDLHVWSRDARAQIARLPRPMATEVEAKFNSRKHSIEA